jgi:hypothetical protein
MLGYMVAAEAGGQAGKTRRREKRDCLASLCISLYMHCEVKAALTGAFQKAVRAYSEAVAELSRAVGTVLYEDYELIQRKVAAVRRISEEARNRLHDHEKQHNC